MPNQVDRTRQDQEPETLAILLSDLHLSHIAPVARAEENWYEVQRRYLHQVRKLAEEHNAPVIYAGDIFDKGWDPQKCPPELINFAIRHMPPGYAIPGQHDLPYHRSEDVHKSAYWTLVMAEVLDDLAVVKGMWQAVSDKLVLHSFPYGTKIEPCPAAVRKLYPNAIHLAVCHQYVWCTNYCFPGAPEERSVYRTLASIQGYDVALFGDNHIPFKWYRDDQPLIYNHGTFIRRKRDEMNLPVQVGLLKSDGKVWTKPLDTSEDQWTEVDKEQPAEPLDTKKVIEELGKLGDSAINFVESVTRYLQLQGVTGDVRKIILDAMKG